MKYELHTIEEKSQINNCPTFHIDKFNWGGDYRPVTYGQMAYIKEKGFIIHMKCEEKDPLRTFVNNEDPVFQDSAMEAFIDFAPEKKKGTYVNIEINANGAMLNRFGQTPPGRKVYTEFTDARCVCTTQIDKDFWDVEVYIPMQYVKDLFGKDTFTTGDIIRCNFYKICQNNTPIAHYGSYTKMDIPSWNFHLPEYFAEAVIV